MESLSKYNQSVVNDKSNHHQQKPPKKSISNENNFNEPSQNGFSKYNDTEYKYKAYIIIIFLCINIGLRIIFHKIAQKV